MLVALLLFFPLAICSRYQFRPFCKLDALFIYHFSPSVSIGIIFRSFHLTLFPICIRWTNFLVFSFNTFNHASTYKLSMIGSTPCTKKVEWLSGLKVRKDKSSNFHHRPTSNDYLDNFHHRRTSNDYLDNFHHPTFVQWLSGSKSRPMTVRLQSWSRAPVSDEIAISWIFIQQSYSGGGLYWCQIYWTRQSSFCFRSNSHTVQRIILMPDIFNLRMTYFDGYLWQTYPSNSHTVRRIILMPDILN